MQLGFSEVRNRHGVWESWRKEIPWLAGVRDGRVYLRGTRWHIGDVSNV